MLVIRIYSLPEGGFFILRFYQILPIRTDP